jgi:hypothetical protein
MLILAICIAYFLTPMHDIMLGLVLAESGAAILAKYR